MYHVHAVFMPFSCHLSLQWTRRRSKICEANLETILGFFDNLEDFGPKILTFVLVKLGLIVKLFWRLSPPKTQGLTKKHPVDLAKSRSPSTSRQREDRAREAKFGFS